MTENTKKWKKLTPDERLEITDLYLYRLRLLKEAEEFNIEALAERFGVSKNTIWSMTKLLTADMDRSGPNRTERLQVNVDEMKRENVELLRSLASLKAVVRTKVEELHSYVNKLNEEVRKY